MAEENEDQTKTEGEADASPRKKKGILLGGGIVGLVGMAYAASLMAVPSTTEMMRMPLRSADATRQ